MNFFQTFFKNPRCNLSNTCFPDCGCKDTAYFLLSKLFNHFFTKNYKINFSYSSFITIYKYRYRELWRGGEGNLENLGSLGNLRKGEGGGHKKSHQRDYHWWLGLMRRTSPLSHETTCRRDGCNHQP